MSAERGSGSSQTESYATVPYALNPRAFAWSDLAGAALHTTARTLIARQTRGEAAAINALGTGIGEAIGYGITRQGMGNPVFNAIAGGIGQGATYLANEVGQGIDALAQWGSEPDSRSGDNFQASHSGLSPDDWMSAQIDLDRLAVNNAIDPTAYAQGVTDPRVTQQFLDLTTRYPELVDQRIAAQQGGATPPDTWLAGMQHYVSQWPVEGDVMLASGSSGGFTEVGNVAAGPRVADPSWIGLTSQSPSRNHTSDGRRVSGDGILPDGTRFIVVESERDPQLDIRELQEADKMPQATEQVLKATLSKEAPIREHKELGLFGGILKFEVGSEKYGIELNTKDGLILSVGSRTLGVGIDTEGRITTEAGIKLKIDPVGERSSFGIGPISADQEGMIKVAPGFKTSVVGLQAGPQGGFNLIEGVTRLADPAIHAGQTLNLTMERYDLLNQIQVLRQEINGRISQLQQVHPSAEYFEFRR